MAEIIQFPGKREVPSNTHARSEENVGHHQQREIKCSQRDGQILKYYSEDIGRQTERIKRILGCSSEGFMNVSKDNLEKFYDYLKVNLELPFHLTGIECFSWEERYVFGGINPAEYANLK